MLKLLIRSLKDAIHPKIIFYSLIPMALSAMILWGIFSVFEGTIEVYILKFSSYIPFVPDEWIENIAESFIGIFIFYQFWIMLALILVGVISDQVVDFVNNRYYHLEKRGFGSMIGSVIVALKSTVIYMILFIITLPLMFIPILNFIVQILLWMVMLKAPMYYDACAFFASKEKFKTIEKKNRGELRFVTFISSLLFLIPFLGVLLYIVQLIMFTHFSLSKLKEL